MTFMTQDRMRRIQGVVFKLPGMITCEVFEGFMDAYLEGTLPARQKLLFEIHLKACKPCRQYLSDYRKMLTTTQALAQHEKDALENVPEDLIAAVLAAQPAESR